MEVGKNQLKGHRTNIAILFSGQGAQKKGICSELLKNVFAKNLDAMAKEVLGYSVIEKIYHGSESELSKTVVAQPVMYFLGYLSYILITENIAVRVLCAGGHSLGEITALAAARVFSFSEGMLIVKKRSLYMEDACKKSLGGMLAVIGESIRRLVPLASRFGVFPANFNSSDQIVFSGELKKLDSFRSKVSELGYRSVLLKVEGAFHSPYMEEASSKFAAFIQKIKFETPVFPVTSNVTGDYHTPDRMKELLSMHISSPVSWVNCVESLSTKEPSVWFETCPGKILLRMLPDKIQGKRIGLKDIKSLEELEATN